SSDVCSADLRLQRIVSKRKKGSKRRSKAVQLLARKHEQIANQRKDTNHKVSRQLVDNYDLIAFEDLNVKGMVKNKHLAKSIHEVSWNQLINLDRKSTRLNSSHVSIAYA